MSDNELLGEENVSDEKEQAKVFEGVACISN